MAQLPGYHFNKRKNTVVPGAIVATIVGVTGIVLLGGVFAAGPVVAYEPEDAFDGAPGTNGLHVVEDTGASNSKALRFGLLPATDDGTNEPDPDPDPTPDPDPVEPDPEPDPKPDPDPTPTPEPKPCTMPPEGVVLDSEPGERPWRMNGAVFTPTFSIAGMSAEWGNHVKRAAAEWSRSYCIDASVITTACTADIYACIPVSEAKLAPNGNVPTLGQAPYTKDNEGYTIKASLQLDPAAHAGYPATEALSTVVHEMGHTLGLKHRLTAGLMLSANAKAGGTPQLPDNTDFYNIAVIYGRQLSQ
ncbi:hypothetical protein JNJ66_00990 [Candidatus Saccharibacteria bacterium]|nr:hypothetical protein [Candidatus Saccharibacteria bacterium]